MKAAGQTGTELMAEGYSITGKLQISKLRFLTEVALPFAGQYQSGWENCEALQYESLPFLVRTIGANDERGSVYGCVEYAPLPGYDLGAARKEVIGHGKSFAGRHMSLTDLDDLPEAIYRDFPSHTAMLVYAGLHRNCSLMLPDAKPPADGS
ncbi:MAG: hypothetical protein HY519_03420 [Candidatus Aenigmarchaeota archaeon]|nr:hypothetical protein [Candidatus Aenigmarchaeota archaeon]